MKLFSTNEVASILNLPNSRVRSFVRAGFIVPERNKSKTLQFNFRDLLFLKTAKSLLEAKVPVKKIIRVLSSLKKRLPNDESLTRLKVYADGRRIVIRDGTVKYQPDTGQVLFDFDPHVVLSAAEFTNRKTEKPTPTAVDWFNQGYGLEETFPKEATNAYLKALEMDPTISDAHVNLGRLFHKAGLMGVLLEDLKRPAEAAGWYEAAIERDPVFADAHYNLGLILDALGKKKDAFGHLRTARKLYLGK